MQNNTKEEVVLYLLRVSEHHERLLADLRTQLAEANKQIREYEALNAPKLSRIGETSLLTN